MFHINLMLERTEPEKYRLVRYPVAYASERDVRHDWMTGQHACDCQRHAVFNGEYGVGDCPCGTTLYQVIWIVCRETGETLARYGTWNTSADDGRMLEYHDGHTLNRATRGKGVGYLAPGKYASMQVWHNVAMAVRDRYRGGDSITALSIDYAISREAVIVMLGGV